MKFLFTLMLVLSGLYSYAQCAGTSNTGTVKGCFLVISQVSKLSTVDSGLWNATPIAVHKGGTGSTTLQQACDSILPSQSGNSGKFLTTDGSDVSWGVADTAVISTPARSISTTGSNNTFTISATRKAFVSYTINIAYALTIASSNGQVDLDYSYNGGGTWINVASVSNAYTVAVTLTGNTNAVLAGFIPPNALVRINRVQNTNVTITLVGQQEMLD